MTITNNSVGRLSFGPPLVNTNGLILYLDAASNRSYTGGTRWKDLSGNGNDFTIHGSVPHNGDYFTLNGTTSQYVQANPFAHPVGDFTIELYERFISFNLTPLYSYAVAADDNEGLLYLPTEESSEIQIRGPAGQINTGYELELNQFYQIVRARSFSDGADELYINGELVFDGTLAAGQQTTTNGSFNIGQEQDSPGGGFRDTQTLNGDLSVVRIYNRVLSAKEIADNYQMTKSRFE
jgi:hypothetical protein